MEANKLRSRDLSGTDFAGNNTAFECTLYIAQQTCKTVEMLKAYQLLFICD